MNYKRLFIPNTIIFITIVTFNRQEILIQNIELLRNAFKNTKLKFKFEIIAISVLKNHIHMLIKPENIDDYPKIIKSIKCNFSSNFDVSTINNYSVSKSRMNKGEKSIWQRRYWEHTIRNEIDLYKHIDYIHYNSFKHYHVIPKNWIYSSFTRFVRQGLYDCNWCNLDDKYGISDLNYE